MEIQRQRRVRQTRRRSPPRDGRSRFRQRRVRRDLVQEDIQLRRILGRVEPDRVGRTALTLTVVPSATCSTMPLSSRFVSTALPRQSRAASSRRASCRRRAGPQIVRQATRRGASAIAARRRRGAALQAGADVDAIDRHVHDGAADRVCRGRARGCRGRLRDGAVVDRRGRCSSARLPCDALRRTRHAPRLRLQWRGGDSAASQRPAARSGVGSHGRVPACAGRRAPF